MTQHTNLYACRLTEEQHRQTCGYWYTVTEGAQAHTAFATLAGLHRWLSERGLRLAGDMVEPRWCRIEGTYRGHAHLYDADIFATLEGERTRAMSNGDYVEAIITTDADGV